MSLASRPPDLRSRRPSVVHHRRASRRLTAISDRAWSPFSAFFTAAMCAFSAIPTFGDVPDVPGWQLVWSDEFNGPEVSTANWDVLTRQHSFNNEKQYYLPEQASIVDGKLRITATNVPIADKQYRSARLESDQAFGPGRFEARIKLPTTQGMWPAFWLFPNSPSVPWPTGGEIDILENRGSQPFLVSSAYHWQTNPGPCCNQHQFVFSEHTAEENGQPVNFHEGFHTYTVIWEESLLRFFVDGKLHWFVTEAPDRPIFETPKNIILNLAVGGHFGGDPDATTIFPQHMDVDYVRVWQPMTGRRGDYNDNGIVDAADYTLWRDSFGMTGYGLVADGSGNGTVDAADYDVWRENLASTAGNAAGQGHSATAVPEPCSAGLLIIGVCAAGRRMQRNFAQRGDASCGPFQSRRRHDCIRPNAEAQAKIVCPSSVPAVATRDATHRLTRRNPSCRPLRPRRGPLERIHHAQAARWRGRDAR